VRMESQKVNPGEMSGFLKEEFKRLLLAKYKDMRDLHEIKNGVKD
jgi:hypothetical protein